MANDKRRQKQLQKQREKKNQKRKALKKQKRATAAEWAKREAVARKEHPLKRYPHWEEGITGLATRMELPWASASAYLDDAVAAGRVEEPADVWTMVRAEVLPEDALLASLAARGVHLDPDGFRAQAEHFRGAQRLVDGLYADLAQDPLIRDHLIAACATLWGRWIPERPSEEQLTIAWGRVSGRLAPSTEDFLQDWVAFAAPAVSALTPEDTDLAGWVESFGEEVEDFAAILGEVGEDLTAGAELEEDIRIPADLLHTVLDHFWTDAALTGARAEWAMATWRAGRAEEAIRSLELQLERAPEQVQLAYTLAVIKGALDDDAAAEVVRDAIDLFERTLAHTDEEDTQIFRAGLKSLRARLATIG